MFLSSAMAKLEEDNTELILIQDSGSDILNEVLKNADVFNNVVMLPGLYDQDGYLRRRLTLISNIAQLQFHLRCTSPDTLVVFNDRRQESQAALHACRSATCIYAEDGTSAYSSITHRNHSGLSLAARKLAYGYWYNPPVVMGTSRWIDKVRATNPSNVRDELQEYPVGKISLSEIRNVVRQNWVQEYLTRLDVSPETLAEVDLILTPTHSSFADCVEGYDKSYHSILESAIESDLSVLINYHPRDNNRSFITNDYENVSVLPDGLSFEFIAASTPNATVVGDISTVLFTAAILSQSTVISIGPALRYEDRRLYQVFKNVGIELVHDVDSLCNQIIQLNKDTNLK